MGKGWRVAETQRREKALWLKNRPVGLEATDSVACSENDSLAQAECTRAIVGELGKVSKGSDHKVPFIPHLGIGSACGRHEFIHTINGKVV